MLDTAPFDAASVSAQAAARFRLGALLYFSDRQGRVLLMRRRRPPNLGLWCSVGGKLETSSGESPFECAQREAQEEVGVALGCSDLALRCILSERDYEGTGHWLMFVFKVLPPLSRLPVANPEGSFRFFDVASLRQAAMPELDRFLLLEKVLGEGAGDLHVMRAEAGAATDLRRLKLEERIGGGR